MSPVPCCSSGAAGTTAAAAARLSARRCCAQTQPLRAPAPGRRRTHQPVTVAAAEGPSAVCPVGVTQVHATEPPSGLPNLALRPISEAVVSQSKALEAFRASGAANRACPGPRGLVSLVSYHPPESPLTLVLPARLLLTGYASEPKSSIVAIGLSVHTAPVEIREKLAIAEAHWPEAIAQLCAFPHVEEAAVLSTCNRMEIYCVVLSYNRGVREVEEFLSKVRPNDARLPCPLPAARRSLARATDSPAVSHAWRLHARAAGCAPARQATAFLAQLGLRETSPAPGWRAQPPVHPSDALLCLPILCAAQRDCFSPLSAVRRARG